MILETERIVLRPIDLADSGRLYLIMSDPVAMAYWEHAAVDDPTQVEDMIAAEIRETAEGRGSYWAIERGEDGAFLGVCDLAGLDWRRRSAEVGFLLAPVAWGHGYGLEAMRAVVVHAASLGLRRLNARTHAGNDHSERLLERLCFTHEGYLRGQVQRDGERRDCKIYGLRL